MSLLISNVRCPCWIGAADDPPGSGLLLQQTLAERRECHGPVQLALNLDGFNPLTSSLVPWLEPLYVAGGSLSANRRRDLPWGDHPRQRFLADPDWDSAAFQQRYADVFSSNYIAELFCQLAWVQDHVDPTEIELPSAEPPFTVPDLLIHCTTARAAKVWPFSHWKHVLRAATSMAGQAGGQPGSPEGGIQRWRWRTACWRAPTVDLRGQPAFLYRPVGQKR